MKYPQLSSLTWKYFWQQKGKEIGTVLLVLVGIALCYIIPHFLGMWNPFNIEHCSFYEAFTVENRLCLSYVMNGWLIIFVAAIIFGAMLLVYYWIQSNWDEASARAKSELRKLKRMK